MINSAEIFKFLSKNGRMLKVNVNTTLYMYEPNQEYKIVLKRYSNIDTDYSIQLYKKGKLIDNFCLEIMYDLSRLDDYLEECSSLSELIDRRIKDKDIKLIRDRAKENEIRTFLNN